MHDPTYDQLNSPLLTDLGFNMQALFAVSDLPESVVKSLPRGDIVNGGCNQSLLLVGNGGARFWQQYQFRKNSLSANPIDEYSVQVMSNFMAQRWPNLSFKVLYPSTHPVGLQKLGELSGWHHPSPMKIGINSIWGLWYAYRALLLVDGRLTPTVKVDTASPCDSCAEKYCVQACPAQALDQQQLRLQVCSDYRLQPQSDCQTTCLARLACPVQTQHQYSAQQIEYHYAQSLRTLSAFCVSPPNTGTLPVTGASMPIIEV